MLSYTAGPCYRGAMARPRPAPPLRPAPRLKGESHGPHSVKFDKFRPQGRAA